MSYRVIKFNLLATSLKWTLQICACLNQSVAAEYSSYFPAYRIAIVVNILLATSCWRIVCLSDLSPVGHATKQLAANTHSNPMVSHD